MLPIDAIGSGRTGPSYNNLYQGRRVWVKLVSEEATQRSETLLNSPGFPASRATTLVVSYGAAKIYECGKCNNNRRFYSQKSGFRERLTFLQEESGAKRDVRRSYMAIEPRAEYVFCGDCSSLVDEIGELERSLDES